MKTVYKYQVKLVDNFELTLPEEAQILMVAYQESFASYALWALVSPDNPVETRRFTLAGTGHPIEEPIKAHITSFQMDNGSLVSHLFELDAG